MQVQKLLVFLSFDLLTRRATLKISLRYVGKTGFTQNGSNVNIFYFKSYVEFVQFSPYLQIYAPIKIITIY